MLSKVPPKDDCCIRPSLPLIFLADHMKAHMNSSFTRRSALIRSGAILGAGLLARASGAHAAAPNAYPSRPVELVLPYSAGGPTDSMGRALAEGLAAELGQPFVVLNKPGAGSLIANESVARSAPDGHTVLLNGIPLAVAPFLYDKPQLDLFRNFTTISEVATFGYVLVINPKLPVNSVKELVEYVRANPGKVNYATPGIGTSPHLGAELFKSLTGVQMTNVAYKGSPQALNDLVAGEVHLYFDAIGSSRPMIETGRVKALATTGLRRSQLMPNLPTVAESGVPGFELTPWLGLFAPANTPREVVVKLSEAMARLSGSASFQTRLRTLGMERAERSLAEFETFLRAETRRWQEVITRANIRA
jgi:tripartite-type tricarboxylate transporter receptor subunit TctC